MARVAHRAGRGDRPVGGAAVRRARAGPRPFAAVAAAALRAVRPAGAARGGGAGHRGRRAWTWSRSRKAGSFRARCSRSSSRSRRASCARSSSRRASPSSPGSRCCASTRGSPTRTCALLRHEFADALAAGAPDRGRAGGRAARAARPAIRPAPSRRRSRSTAPTATAHADTVAQARAAVGGSRRELDAAREVERKLARTRADGAERLGALRPRSARRAS